MTSMQMFVDLYSGTWDSVAPPWVDPTFGEFCDAYWIRGSQHAILLAMHKSGSSKYALFAVPTTGPDFSPDTLVELANDRQYAMRNEMAALEAVGRWVDYLDGGGTLDAWHMHYTGTYCT